LNSSSFLSASLRSVIISFALSELGVTLTIIS
jgi:hypothetical protein